MTFNEFEFCCSSESVIEIEIKYLESEREKERERDQLSFTISVVLSPFTDLSPVSSRVGVV